VAHRIDGIVFIAHPLFMKASLALLALLLGLAVPAPATVQYAVTEIRAGDFAFTSPNSINASGQIVGSAHNFYAYARPVYRWPAFPVTSFLFANGTTTILPGLGGSAVTASAINDSGSIVGSSSLTDSAGPHPLSTVFKPAAIHAFLNVGGAVSDLGTLGGATSQATGINAAGLIVGSSAISGDKHTHAFLFSGGAMTDLGTLGGRDSKANAINASGQIVGSASLPGDKHTHAFLVSGGAMIDLGTLGGRDSAANAINAAGQIGGSAATARDKATHAFLYADGVMTNLGPAGSDYSEASAISDSGQIVGTFSTPLKSGAHAFLYAAGTFTDLNSLISRTSGWQLNAATAVNAAGLIVGTGTLNQRAAAFLLTPIDGATPVPTLAVAGGKTFTSTGPRLAIRGTSAGSALSVTYRVGAKGPFLRAHGVGRWLFTARLLPGKNVVTIVAHGPGGDSAPARIAIQRK